MTDDVENIESPFALRAADVLASEVIYLVKSAKLDARCPAADAALEYASIRFGSQDPINDLIKHVEEQGGRPEI